MKVQYYNRSQLSEDMETELSAKYCSTVDELIKTSDVISLNCPLTPETRGLIGANEFAKMKDGVIIVNTDRGAVIDEKAFIEALESGKVARAGLDVFDGEPKVKYVPVFPCVRSMRLHGVLVITSARARDVPSNLIWDPGQMLPGGMHNTKQ